MKLFLVRHGQTIENIEKIVLGHQAGILSPKGVKQAKLLAKYLKNYKFDAIYCSDLKRAVDTLREIIKYHQDTPVFYAKELRDTCMGKMEGKNIKEYFAVFSKLPGTYSNRKMPGGESQIDVRKRVAKFVKFLKKNHAKDKILIVSHGGLIKKVLAILLKVPTKRLRSGKVDIGNASICEVTTTPKRTIIHCVNKTDYLN